MKYQVDGWNNFCRVFELPEDYPEGFCFCGGFPVNFQMVDWFNPVSDIGHPAVSKDVWREEFGEIEVKEITLDELRDNLFPWLIKKQYIKQSRLYLIYKCFDICSKP